MGTAPIAVAGPLTLSESTAKTFNEAFAEGKRSFSAGKTMGTLGFVAVAQ